MGGDHRTAAVGEDSQVDGASGGRLQPHREHEALAGAVDRALVTRELQDRIAVAPVDLIRRAAPGRRGCGPGRDRGRARPAAAARRGPLGEILCVGEQVFRSRAREVVAVLLQPVLVDRDRVVEPLALVVVLGDAVGV